jgi:hypothetical protein
MRLILAPDPSFTYCNNPLLVLASFAASAEAAEVDREMNMRAPIATLLLGASAAFGYAQAGASLPDAPEPAAATGRIPFVLADGGANATAEQSSGGESTAAPPEAESLTMFPHSDTARLLDLRPGQQHFSDARAFPLAL